jgi:endo-1,4-beta-xylanase
MQKAANKLCSIVAKIMLMLILVCATASVSTISAYAAQDSLLSTYGATYGYSGTCINLYQLKDANTLATLKKDYNSITLENEMKPDALLGGSPTLISVSQAKSQGYYIPDNYKESYVPRINFNTVDEVMKICYNNGLKMRAHTLVWHSQTPSWFFRNGFNAGSGFVNSSTMDARLEMYVKTVMNHVYTNQYGSVVYAWDVANEILHASNSGWEAVYGSNKTNASYVKKAFNYAYDTLSYFKLTDSVKLFYNDYNTYMKVNDVIKLVNYINDGRKVCAGVGMQSHLGTNFPSVDYYTAALKSFVNAGFEVQITELDITNKGDTDLANYAYSLFKNINSIVRVHFLNDVCSMSAHHMTTNDGSASVWCQRSGDEFQNAVGFVHGQSFTVGAVESFLADIFDSLFLTLVFGKADACHLWCGEDGSRHGREVDGVFLAKDVIDRMDTLEGGCVGKHLKPVDIADGVDFC